MAGEKSVNIDSSTRVSLGFLRDYQTYLIGGLVWLIVNMESIKHRLANIEEKFPQTWTLDNQLLFESKLRGGNQGMFVPDSSNR